MTVIIYALVGAYVFTFGLCVGRMMRKKCECGMPLVRCEELVSGADNEYMMRCGEPLPCMWHTPRHTCEACGCTNYVRPK
jgi:hypothetical protein